MEKSVNLEQEMRQAITNAAAGAHQIMKTAVNLEGLVEYLTAMVMKQEKKIEDLEKKIEALELELKALKSTDPEVITSE